VRAIGGVANLDSERSKNALGAYHVALEKESKQNRREENE
jgi:hypothetical protein